MVRLLEERVELLDDRAAGGPTDSGRGYSYDPTKVISVKPTDMTMSRTSTTSW